MSNKWNMAAAGVVVGLLGSSASAADMPVKAPMAAAPAPLWSGFYVGLNAGAGWLRDPFTTAPGGTLVSTPFDGSLGWGEALTGSRNTAFTGGGQIGYSQQVNSGWVLGIESDIQYLGATVNAANTFTSTVPPFAGGGAATVTDSLSSKVSWFGTTRARVGTTTINPNLLVYVTGGFAYGSEKLSGLTSTTIAGGATLLETFPYGSTQTVFGYAVGAGGEYAIDRHWSIKAEYMFVQLGAASQTRTTTTFGPQALATDAMTLSTGHENISIARGGINYRF
jgi:outer membrane immunogenic protein